MKILLFCHPDQLGFEKIPPNLSMRVAPYQNVSSGSGIERTTDEPDEVWHHEGDQQIGPSNE
jgi:hypothetical protein